MSTNRPARVTDKQLRDKLIGFLKVHGPFRAKPMSKNARLPYERMMVMLALLESERIVVRTPDGIHRRLPVVAWALAEGQFKRTSYGGAEALLAMQAAARSRLMECRA